MIVTFPRTLEPTRTQPVLHPNRVRDVRRPNGCEVPVAAVRIGVVVWTALVE